MKKTNRQVLDALGLDDPPDDEFMELLATVGEESIVVGPQAASADEGYSPGAIVRELNDALVAATVGELLAHARAETGQSLRDVGTRAGVTRSRIQQLESSENVEVATLVRVAGALGFGVRITLQPEDEGRREGMRTLVADLANLRT